MIAGQLVRLVWVEHDGRGGLELWDRTVMVERFESVTSPGGGAEFAAVCRFADGFGVVVVPAHRMVDAFDLSVEPGPAPG